MTFRRSYPSPRRLVTDTTTFWIASVTKSFTAATILELAQRHLLSVGDTVGHFFPSAPATHRGITIHQLLTHTAGFSQTYAASAIPGDMRSEAVRRILAQPLAYAPGKGYRYGDDDYQLLAAIIEEVTGRSWENAVREMVLGPAGLRHTGFQCAVDPSSRHEPPTNCRLDWGHKGANGMAADAGDLLKWATVFRPLARPERLVRREGADDVFYGYGARIYLRDGRVTEVMHSGSGDDGHTAIVRQLASGVTVVVLSDAGQHAGTTWASYVAGKLVTR